MRSAVQPKSTTARGLTGGPAAAPILEARQCGPLVPLSKTQISATALPLTLTDGGPGDADGVENGEIVDPGGSSVAAAVTPVPVPVPALVVGAARVLIAGFKCFPGPDGV